MNVMRSIGLFALAGLAEIGGGYLVWRWLREGAPWPAGLAGAVILIGYGIIPTLQSSSDFGRVYAAYGGVFVIIPLSAIRSTATPPVPPGTFEGRLGSWAWCAPVTDDDPANPSYFVAESPVLLLVRRGTDVFKPPRTRPPF